MNDGKEKVVPNRRNFKSFVWIAFSFVLICVAVIVYGSISLPNIQTSQTNLMIVNKTNRLIKNCVIHNENGTEIIKTSISPSSTFFGFIGDDVKSLNLFIHVTFANGTSISAEDVVRGVDGHTHRFDSIIVEVKNTHISSKSKITQKGANFYPDVFH
ncbi:hypothetical protein HG66A1_42690 [Gimesia chilikensis]|uniref:Uncharacterized protein n=1 Tax=Gimesia chilikensis TaxID=2605989 RepID=A0A517PSW2_9PLAN|nr:hypothetical protein HG66A1_42690 [Gimesia chilikensis]